MLKCLSRRELAAWRDAMNKLGFNGNSSSASYSSSITFTAYTICVNFNKVPRMRKYLNNFFFSYCCCETLHSRGILFMIFIPFEMDFPSVLYFWWWCAFWWIFQEFKMNYSFCQLIFWWASRVQCWSLFMGFFSVVFVCFLFEMFVLKMWLEIFALIK